MCAQHIDHHGDSAALVAAKGTPSRGLGHGSKGAPRLPGDTVTRTKTRAALRDTGCSNTLMTVCCGLALLVLVAVFHHSCRFFSKQLLEGTTQVFKVNQVFLAIKTFVLLKF